MNAPRTPPVADTADPDEVIGAMLADHPTPWKATWERCGTPGMDDCGAWTVLDAADRPVAMLGDTDDDEATAHGIAALANDWPTRHRFGSEQPVPGVGPTL